MDVLTVRGILNFPRGMVSHSLKKQQWKTGFFLHTSQTHISHMLSFSFSFGSGERFRWLNLGSNLDWFSLPHCWHRGVHWLNLLASTKSVRQSIQEWDSLQTCWNDFWARDTSWVWAHGPALTVCWGPGSTGEGKVMLVGHGHNHHWHDPSILGAALVLTTCCSESPTSCP